ncbi:MAG TPA: NUDIX domain-containing protein [Nitrospirota bacterium]|nr:NUDIX domain-containing protein [Nitrospirota bacterium]
MEFFDILDCRGEKTGETISRDEAHRTGVWHGAFHCLIVNRLKGTVLFQKRSRDKKIAPARYDVSVGGHYASGEQVEDAAPREIREELGLEVQFSDLIPVGKRIFVYCFAEGVREYEFQDVFLLPAHVESHALKLQREELDGVIEMDVEKGIALLSGALPVLEQMLLKPDGRTESATVSKQDFVPCLDEYYLKLLLIARRYVNGERSMLII